MCAKVHQRMYFLSKFILFNVRYSILHLFYQSIILYVASFSCVVMYKIDRITKVASKTFGFEVKHKNEIVDSQLVLN